MVSQRWIALLSLAFSLLSLPSWAVTRLTAQIDKNPVMYGEEILLQLQADEKLARDAIDFSVLDKDFRVNGPAISQSMQIINGQTSQSTTWQLALYPKRTGEIVIPAFQIDAAASQAITVNVLEKPQLSSGEQPELFVKNSLSQSSLYVQQMAYYEVKIFFKGDLKSGALTAPNIAGCSIEQVGKDAESSELVNGERYQTITRRYSITPQQSGEFKIEAPFFKGEMIERTNDTYDYYAKQKTVSAEGEIISFKVEPIPTDFTGDWLVSDLIALTEEWSVTGNELMQGEPVTRTITLTALDLMENQLPDLKMPNGDGFKVYPEQPQAKKAERNGRIVAQKIFTFAIMPNKAGELVLPEITVPWFNTQTREITSTTLSKKQFKVLPNSDQPTANETPAISATAEAQSPVTTMNGASWWLPSWQITFSTLTALGIALLTLAFLLWQKVNSLSKQSNNVVVMASKDDSFAIKFNRHKLKAACLANDEELAKTLLLRWGNQQIHASIRTLNELLHQLPDGDLKQAIFQLCHRRFQANVTPWQGQALFELWAKYQHQQIVSHADPLKPLYPE